jgi:hypothetical protein
VRASRTVLREARGEIPLAYSPIQPVRYRTDHRRTCGPGDDGFGHSSLLFFFEKFEDFLLRGRFYLCLE